MVTDAEAIAAFLGSYDNKSPHTKRLYRREITVFLYWLRALHEDHPIHPSAKLSLLEEIGVDELLRYRDFITHSFGFEDAWKNAGVSEPSAEVVFKILALLLDWVYRSGGKAPHLDNPARIVLAAIRAKRKKQLAATLPDSFNSIEWRMIQARLVPSATDNSLQSARERWTVYLIFYAGLRRDEAAHLAMCNFAMDGRGVATLQVGPDCVEVSTHLIDQLALYRTALGLPRNGYEMDQSPAIQSMRRQGLQVTPQTILRLVQAAFARVADQLPEPLAVRAKKATPQTIRNTALRVALEEGEAASSIAARMRCSLGWVHKAEETYRPQRT